MLRDAAVMWVHHTPHSCMRLSKSGMNGPYTIVPSSSGSRGSGSGSGCGDVIRGKMMIPPNAIDYSCDDETEGCYYFIYYHYM